MNQAGTNESQDVSDYLEKVRSEKLERFRKECRTYLEAKDIMTPRVITIFQDSRIRDAVDLFLKEKITALVVVNMADDPIGVFSETDLARFERQKPGHLQERGGIYTAVEIEDYLGNIHKGIENKSAYNEKIGNWMTPNLITVDPSDSLPTCCKVLSKNKIHRIFVKDKKIIGVISNSDIVRSLAY